MMRRRTARFVARGTGIYRGVNVHMDSATMKRLRVLACLLCLAGAGKYGRAQDARHLVDQMVAHEDEASTHRQHYTYVAVERSERTGGRLWKERVAETSAGKVRLLLEEDGQPLAAARAATERARLAAIVADPTAFTASERAKKNDDDKARAMLDLLPKAFLVENARPEGAMVRVDFRPNPDYQTQTAEEKVLHGMSGWLTIDAQALRLHELQARLPQDVSVGFGLASIHAGSSFGMRRDKVATNEWKTALVDTNINGKAILFKSLGKNEHVDRTEIRLIPFDLSIPDAVAMVER